VSSSVVGLELTAALGWVTGTGGGISIRKEYARPKHMTSANSSEYVYLAPSGTSD
jgi:ribulose-5-phosphate 4-epimerase/fuculose-1-phosphate aldolase